MGKPGHLRVHYSFPTCFVSGYTPQNGAEEMGKDRTPSMCNSRGSSIQCASNGAREGAGPRGRYHSVERGETLPIYFTTLPDHPAFFLCRLGLWSAACPVTIIYLVSPTYSPTFDYSIRFAGKWTARANSSKCQTASTPAHLRLVNHGSLSLQYLLPQLGRNISLQFLGIVLRGQTGQRFPSIWERGRGKNYIFLRSLSPGGSWDSR